MPWRLAIMMSEFESPTGMPWPPRRLAMSPMRDGIRPHDRSGRKSSRYHDDCRPQRADSSEFGFREPRRPRPLSVLVSQLESPLAVARARMGGEYRDHDAAAAHLALLSSHGHRDSSSAALSKRPGIQVYSTVLQVSSESLHLPGLTQARLAALRLTVTLLRVSLPEIGPGGDRNCMAVALTRTPHRAAAAEPEPLTGRGAGLRPGPGPGCRSLRLRPPGRGWPCTLNAGRGRARKLVAAAYY
jgi:hypothetical protein